MSKIKKMTILSLILFSCIGVRGQAVVTDPLNTVQSTITAGNTAATVKQAIDQVKKLQTALDYVQKVSATVKRAQMFKDLIDRQNRLNKNCLQTLEEAKQLNPDNMARVSSGVQSVINNNSAIISLTSDILSGDLKMNDGERMKQLKKCRQRLQEQEQELGTIRQIIDHSRTIKRNLGLITE